VLVEALLLIPAAAARNLCRGLGSFVYTTMALATISCIGGILIPMQWDLPVPSGGAIVMVAASFFILTTIVRNVVPGFREAKV
jgi:zinc transport system permease protein